MARDEDQDEEAYVRVRFSLPDDGSGWPPAVSEGLWAVDLGDGRYRLDNVPFFVRGVACHDTVAATMGDDGHRWATEVLHASGRLTVRVIVLGEHRADTVRELRDVAAACGIESETMDIGFGWDLLAFDLPPAADLARFKSFLATGERLERWSYEEGLVDDRWRSA